MKDATHSPEESPRRRGFAAHPVKATAIILGVLAFLLFIGFWLISYVNLLSFEWDGSQAIKVVALGQGQLSLSRWSIPSFPALVQVDDFHSGKTGNGRFPEINIDGNYRNPRNAIQFLGGAWFYWHHGAESAWIVLVPCWVPVAIASLALLCIGARRLLRRWRQHKPGTCRKCGYDLRASSERCPECGTDISNPQPKRKFATRSRIAMAMLVLAVFVTTAGALIYKHSIIPEPPPIPAFVPPPDPPGYEKVRRRDALLESAPASQPSPADAQWVIDEVLHDPDYGIRVRVMAILPYLRDRKQAIDVLMACLHERDKTLIGDGFIPRYAATYLADMGVYSAIPDIKSWIDYLQSKKVPFDEKLRLKCIQTGLDDLARLKMGCPQSASQPATKVHN